MRGGGVGVSVGVVIDCVCEVNLALVVEVMVGALGALGAPPR